MDQRQPERESIWSIGRKWLPWYLLTVFVMVIGWTAFAAWLESGSGRHGNLPEIAYAVVRGTAPAAALIPIYALLIISTLDLGGGAIVVTYRYLSNKFLKPLEEKMRQESERIREESLQEGREENQRLWAAWNQRRLEAERNGEPFNEPPPGTSDYGKQAVEE